MSGYGNGISVWYNKKYQNMKRVNTAWQAVDPIWATNWTYRENKELYLSEVCTYITLNRGISPNVGPQSVKLKRFNLRCDRNKWIRKRALGYCNL